MPSYLDFDSTKKFRDFIIGKTLNNPNGPQTFDASSYTYQKLSDFPNVDPGDVVNNVSMNRLNKLNTLTGVNLYRPIDGYEGLDRVINTEIINQNGLPLRLYPYFPTELPNHNLISIMGSSSYETESKLFQFAASNIKNNSNGPVYSRIARNLDKSINSKNRLIDALNGNTSTALNLLTGRENLIEYNNSITVNKTLIGKGIDFLETVTGIEVPFSQIPGDYLTNPLNNYGNFRTKNTDELSKTIQDATGAIGSMLGVQRRPTDLRKPSDIFIEYMGQGQKQNLYNNLSYSKYAPNYTTTARSQNTSKIFNFIDNVTQDIKTFLGDEAPLGIAYIGDDRGNDVKFAMNDFNDRPVRSGYYLNLMFDSVATRLLQRTKNLSDGGSIGGNLTWISANSKNKLGANNAEYSKEYSKEESLLLDSLSTKYQFRESSILAYTQEILNTLPTDGSRSHVANVIDQTSRVFVDGDIKISKGSEIKYVNKFNNDEAGVEYCRIWTKDRAYMNYTDTMKTTSNIRKFDSSVMGGRSRPWNLNIAPMSNGKKSFDNSTNIENNWQFGGGNYAKKYMFSIENLAWKTSNTDGYKVSDLPACERGPNGGRVMWFPPYGLKVSEQNSAKWDESSFLGRPEPIYTYQNTTRSGQISFKVIVDHPSILNLLVREKFEGMSDEESDNYINAFFAGCQDVDFYELIQTYTTLEPNDINLVLDYINDGKTTNKQEILKYKYTSVPVTEEELSVPSEEVKIENVVFNTRFYFENDRPYKTGKNSNDPLTNENYNTLFTNYSGKKNEYLTKLNEDLLEILNGNISKTTDAAKDRQTIIGNPYPLANLVGSQLTARINQIVAQQTQYINDGFTEMVSNYDNYKDAITVLKENIEKDLIEQVTITIITSASEAGENDYNFYIGVRRAYSIFIDFIDKFSKIPNFKIKWFTEDFFNQYKNSQTPLLDIAEYKLSDLGYNSNGIIKFQFQTAGEQLRLDATPFKSNLNCSTKINTVKGLKITSPLGFYCRQSTVLINYNKIEKPKKKETEIIPPRTIVEAETTIIEGKIPKKPTINVLQKIIMKTLSECYYFKKLEENSPLVFKSLTEKLKYFHPGFHSMTPEGLNSRLTFLLQCIRPGETIPIKGLADNLDINARNTSFGPAPVCILRIGDFYHSKILIRDVNITYDETTWDMNPEGIGMQPMIADVTLQINFIGGQGLDKPVEKLQNALTSNFFANTEMYDERAKITSMIDGKDENTFTTENLQKLYEKSKNILNNKNRLAEETLINGTYLGGIGPVLSYNFLIENVYDSIKAYIINYSSQYNKILKEYGRLLTPLFFNKNYKSVNTFLLEVNGGTNENLSMFGEFSQSKNLSYYSRILNDAILSYINTQNIDFNSMIGLNKNLIDDKNYAAVNVLITNFIINKIKNKIDDISDFKIKDLILNRNSLIKSLDEVNFLTKYGFDSTIKDNKTYKGIISGFTSTSFYNEFSPIIDFYKVKQGQFEIENNNLIDFNNPIFTNEKISDIISVLLQNESSNILTLISSAMTLDDSKKQQIIDILNSFISIPQEIDFKINKIPSIKNDKVLNYNVTEVEETNPTVVSDIIKIWSFKNKINDSTLNYYRNG